MEGTKGMQLATASPMARSLQHPIKDLFDQLQDKNQEFEDLDHPRSPSFDLWRGRRPFRRSAPHVAARDRESPPQKASGLSR